MSSLKITYKFNDIERPLKLPILSIQKSPQNFGIFELVYFCEGMIDISTVYGIVRRSRFEILGLDSSSPTTETRGGLSGVCTRAKVHAERAVRAGRAPTA